MHEIKKLDQQVINQIAAGEVVERPASVVKELIENAIDAGATEIDVYIEDGGLGKIEIRDNGKGIDKDDIPTALERYATSKLSTTDDLEQISTYGFRGEALAAISSVSKTTLVTRRGDTAFSIISDNGKLSQLTPSSRSQGTTITIEHLFESVPARQKFLKAADTEYKYIVKIFTSFALLNGNIHFTLTNNSKEIYNLPPTEELTLPKERVAKICSVPTESLVKIQHEEYGIKINGYLLHPKSLGSISKFSQLFINNRPVEDKGVFRSVQQGIAGFVPDFFKPSFAVAITLSSEQVDVNVHPRKTEVKLLNPFRVYSAVTHAIKQALQTEVAEPDRVVGQSSYQPETMQTRQFSSWDKKQDTAYSRLRGNQPQFFFEGSHNNSENFSENSRYQIPIEPESLENEPKSLGHIPEYIVNQAKLSLSEADITPILGRYIIVGFMDEVWVVDQHAAAERVRYEQFKRAYMEGQIIPQQQLLVGISITLSEEERIVLTKHNDFFQRVGFTVKLQDYDFQISSVPTFLQRADLSQLIRDTIGELVEHDEIFTSPVIEDFSSEKNISLAIATMACHNSVRMNERLSPIEARSIIKALLECQIPYACPHGRRIVWRLSKEEIDRQFMRI